MLRKLFRGRFGLQPAARVKMSQSARYFVNDEADLTEEEDEQVYEHVMINGKRFRKNAEDKFIVTMFEGDGIGPEIAKSVRRIFKAANVPIVWEQHQIHKKAQTKEGDLISKQAIDSVVVNGVGLKGPFMTPIGKGFRSLNVTMRQRLKLSANVRPCRSIPGLPNKYEDVNVVTIRQNTEGEYSGLEHKVYPGVCESLKVITRAASLKVAKHAFEYARLNGRKTVSICHKAGVMPLSDGLFYDTCTEVAKDYPDIECKAEQVDTVCMKLAKNPNLMDLMLMPNLYGDIVSDLCAGKHRLAIGLIGGLGLTPSGNIGDNAAVFEAVHGTAPDIAGKNISNPTALLLSAVMMLRYMSLTEEADRIEQAVLGVLGEGRVLTRDLGGRATNPQFTEAIVQNLP